MLENCSTFSFVAAWIFLGEAVNSGSRMSLYSKWLHQFFFKLGGLCVCARLRAYVFEFLLLFSLHSQEL